MIIKKEFYNRSSLMVAQELLGAYLVRQIGNKIIKTKIVETEAYEGFDDKASHASRGRTPRNGVMFGEAGIAYVYFTYGMHFMLNIVTGPKDHPAAVLIRAVEPLGSAVGNTNGPARSTKSLLINKAFNGLSVCTRKYGLWVEQGKPVEKRNIVRAKRVGVDYAGIYKDKLWRFYIKGNEFVSKK